MKHYIYDFLEDHRDIVKTEKYYQVFVLAILSTKCWFLFIAFFNTDKIKYVFKVKLIKVCYFLNMLHKLIYKRCNHSILNSYFA